MLVRTAVLLVLVCGLAVVTIRLAARWGVGRSSTQGAAPKLAILEELVVGPRLAVVAIRAADRVILASRTPTGLTPLSELPLRSWGGELQEWSEDVPAERARSFAEVLEGKPSALVGASGNGASHANEEHAPEGG